jgi:hypothetical protein
VIPLGVTVTARQGYRWAGRARDKAAEWGLPFFDRPDTGGLDPLLEREAQALLVYGGSGWVLHDARGELAFSPGMATVRLKRLEHGTQQPDILVRLAELKAGDEVLDGTLGLGADALVCARVVGPKGRVVGLEASLPLFRLVHEGLRTAPLDPKSCRIEVLHALALEYLSAREARSVDCVILDPMFQRPKKSGGALEVLRRFAVHEPLTAELLAQARRVARRWVVVKCGRYDRTFSKLGLQLAAGSTSSPVVWARIGPLT